MASRLFAAGVSPIAIRAWRNTAANDEIEETISSRWIFDFLGAASMAWRSRSQPVRNSRSTCNGVVAQRHRNVRQDVRAK